MIRLTSTTTSIGDDALIILGSPLIGLGCLLGLAWAYIETGIRIGYYG